MPETQSMPKPKRRINPIGCLKWAFRLSLLGSVFAVGAGVVLTVMAFATFQYYVVWYPGTQVDRAHIRTIIAQESPVYFRDGTTRVGVFFESEHRAYVPYSDMPPAYVFGIVAAEDGNFWTHGGINPKGIARAMRDNVLAFGMVAGGSTLTQQTAKNLYYRPDRSARSKLIELLNAMRLERHFEKHEILEFYVNQFHVTGNGRGLGIAARHFFDKDPEDLTILESAFIAGLVKGPANYDPFLGDEARRKRALGRAHDRTRYVLGRILEEDGDHLAGPKPKTPEAREAQTKRLAELAVVRTEAQRLLDEGFSLPFRRGTFRYESSAILDEVARRLAEAPFDAVLGNAGIDDPINAGLVVVTTLDADAQREATYALWHHLTEVGSWMEGIGVEAFVLKGSRGPRFDPDFPPQKHEFRVAKIYERTGATGKKAVRLDIGGHPCDVDREGIVRVAVASYRGKKGDGGAKLSSAEVDAFIDAIPDDAVLLVSVRDTPKNGVAKCDIEVRPELQGAVTVLQDGEVRAMVGGNDNRNFNRATALRQFGSTWKPLVYHAALLLGWSPDEPIDNSRNVFPFSTTFYYPRPDHEPASRVSIAWAGVNSENLASVWLLYHLLDRLDGDQLRRLAVSTDLALRPDESTDDYRKRVQELGILPTPDRVNEGHFLQSRQEVLAGISGARHPEDAVALQGLLYGWGFSSERARAEREPASSRGVKLRALSNDWRMLSDRLSSCAFQHEALERAFRQRTVPDKQVVGQLSVLLDGEAIKVACGEVPEGYVAPDADFVSALPWGGTPEEEPESLAPEPVEAPEPEPERRRFGLFGGRAGSPEVAPEPGSGGGGGLFRRKGPAVVELPDMLIDDRLHVSTIEAVVSAFERRKLTAGERPDLYDPEVLYWHQDFRTLLAIRYVASLAEDYGVQTDIKEVLSMPLGASEITLEEATSMYSGLVSGLAYEFAGSTPKGEAQPILTSTSLIKEIRNVDGKVLYRSEPTTTAVAEPMVGEMTADILRNVVMHGTGRRASSSIQHGGKPVPVGGKTGTTNDFKNAAFVGYVPAATPVGYKVAGGFTIGVYVGYDDNRSMSNKRIKLAGSSGALPAWIGTAAGLAEYGLLAEPPALDAPAQGWALLSEGGNRVTVDNKTGLQVSNPMVPAEGTATVLVRTAAVAPADVDVPRLHRPPRIAPGTEEALPEGRRGRRERDEPEQVELIPEMGDTDDFGAPD